MLFRQWASQVVACDRQNLKPFQECEAILKTLGPCQPLAWMVKDGFMMTGMEFLGDLVGLELVLPILSAL